MALSEFRDAPSWQGAIDLGPKLVQLAEELPTAEAMGLSLQLRQAMVDLPAAIAFDLLETDSFTRKPAMLRLLAMLDLIEKVYPALDTAEVRETVEKLAEEIAVDKLTAKPAPAQAPKPATPPDPASVPVVPEAAAEPVKVAVEAGTDSTESHVQPDSVQ